jgi:hypothetical protein
MAYRTDTADYAAVCQRIGWRAEMRAVETMRRGSTVYVRGTLLKPNELSELRGFDGSKLADGSAIRVKGV